MGRRLSLHTTNLLIQIIDWIMKNPIAIWICILIMYGMHRWIYLWFNQELKQRIELVKEKSCKDGVFTSESEFSDEMMEIRKDFVTIHGEMVLLKNYSSLNFAGMTPCSSFNVLFNLEIYKRFFPINLEIRACL